MSLEIREEVPIKSFAIAAYICKIENGTTYFLLIRRCGKVLNGNWQMVSGKIEKGETAWQAALREIKEETNLVPEKLYSADWVERFYDATQNCINLVPVFVAFVKKPFEVKLAPAEHDAYKWVTKDEMMQALEFRSQKDALNHIDTYFVKNKPTEFLRINFDRKNEN